MLRSLFTLLCLVCLTVDGQTLRVMWATMPDDILPAIEKSKREELISLYDISTKAIGDSTLLATVSNKLGGNCRLDTLTSDFLRLQLSKSSVMEMKMLPGESATADSLLCISLTLFGELPESKVSLYSSDWKLLSDTIYTEPSLLQKPDSVSEQAFAEALDHVTTVLWQAQLSANSNELVLSPSFLFVTNEEKDTLQPLHVQKILNWNGRIFK